MAHGKHRKPEDHTTTTAIVATGALSLAAIAATTGTANAAPEDAWDRIAECESNQRWDLPYGDNGKSSGGLQFQPASWSDALDQLARDGIDVSAFPQGPGHQAYKATKAQQILAGEALLKLQGPGAWACNSMVGGPLNGYSGGDYSRYAGGAPAPADPAPDLPEAVPGDSHPDAKEDPAPAPAPKGDECVHSTHTVEPGDTLYGITKAHTGNGALDNWEPLYEANRGVVGGNPDLIFPGQVLELPWADADAPAPAPAPVEETPAPDLGPDPVHDGDNGNLAASGFAPPLADLSGMGDGYFAGPGGSYSRSGGGHSGVDFTAPAGTPVFAVAGGTVEIGGAGDAYGTHVLINHGDGFWTLYAHLSGTDVFDGATVSAGDPIGSVGSTGNSSGPHLHFEVRTNGNQFNGFVDPVAWLQAKGVL